MAELAGYCLRARWMERERGCIHWVEWRLTHRTEWNGIRTVEREHGALGVEAEEKSRVLAGCRRRKRPRKLSWTQRAHSVLDSTTLSILDNER